MTVSATVVEHKDDTIPPQPAHLYEANTEPDPDPEPDGPKVSVQHYPSHVVPSLLFIIPYRDREDDLSEYQKQMVQIMDHYPRHSYRFVVVHQNDDRSFNRGAIKNIGFLWARRKYPHHYRKITFVFNDVDTFPLQRHVIPSWYTKPGTIRHFYGYEFALGGIFSITGGDFETINGFPNYWGYGYEDNLINKRALDAGLTITRDSPFFNLVWVQPGPFFRPDKARLLQTTFRQRSHGFERVLNRYDHAQHKANTKDGMRNLQRIRLEEEEVDELFVLLHVSHFDTQYEENPDDRIVHDLRNGLRPFGDFESTPTPTATPTPTHFQHHHQTRRQGVFPLTSPSTSSSHHQPALVSRRMFRFQHR